MMIVYIIMVLSLFFPLSLMKVFTRMGNNYYVDQQTLPVPMSARFIRFHPITQKYWNNFRVEVYEGI